MKTYGILAFAGLVAVTLAPAPAHAAKGGCLKYGAAGAVAGHVAGRHAVKGAIAGCLIGHWRRRDAEWQHSRQARPPVYQGQPSYRARQAGWNRY